MNGVSLVVRRCSVGLRNRDRHGQPSLGQVEFTSPLLRFVAYVADDGHVCLPDVLVDQGLRRCLAAAAREEVLAQLDRDWTARTEREAAEKVQV